MIGRGRFGASVYLLHCMDAQLRALLVSPCCRAPLHGDTDGLSCSVCSRSYQSSASGQPILFPESSEVSRTEADAHYGKRRPLPVRVLRALLRPVDLKARPTLHDRLRDEVVFGAPPGSLVLNVGSGIETFVRDARIVNFDIAPHPNTHVVGDGHHLPFASDTFDVVWLSAVLEHVRKPWLVAEQVYEVLKPGGVVLVSVPFIQKRHGSPNDYYRYTVDGLRSLFDRFEEIEGGSSFTGPTGTVVHVLSAWMNAVFPGRLGFAVEVIAARVLSPAKYLDRLVSDASLERGILTGGSCYYGRKPSFADGHTNGRPGGSDRSSA